MKINIRLAEESDFNRLIELMREFAEFENHPEAMMNSVERMKRESEYFSCFLAETGDYQIVGYAAWFFAYYTWTGKSLYIDDLYVSNEYRGKGIGKMLMKRVIEFATTSGCHKIRWQVSDWNEPAMNMYRKMGAEIDTSKLNCDLTVNI
jgi:GNAT superfamily N-acetyltransferase